MSARADNVNTGACDSIGAACDVAHAHGAWAHVDGAFGLWAAASPKLRHLCDGIERADSWGTDGHKWLNVPYDSGDVFCAHPEAHAASMAYTAAYLVGNEPASIRAPGDYVMESSRRARGFHLRRAARARPRRCRRSGRAVRELARRFADQLRAVEGVEIGNDVVLNQVLVRFGGDDAETDRVIAVNQLDGTSWAGGTTWRGRRYMRISVSSWSTTEGDIDRTVATLVEIAKGATGVKGA